MTTMLRCCHHFAGQCGKRGRGGLLLVGSGACYGGGSFMATYSANKAFDLCFGESLWAELRPHDVDVLYMALGTTDTPALHALLDKKGLPLPAGLASPDEVATVGLARLPFGPVHNWGQADDVAGYAPSSASARRARILAVDAAASRSLVKHKWPYAQSIQGKVMTDNKDESAAATRLGSLVGNAAGDAPLVEVNDHVWVSKDISDSIIITTGAGNVVVNTGMPGNGEQHRQRFRKINVLPFEYIIITQCHGDHFGGAMGMRDSQTRIITQQRYEECREYWRILHDFYSRRSGKLWGSVLEESR